MAPTLSSLGSLSEDELLQWVRHSVKTSSNIFSRGYQGHVYLYERDGLRLIIKAPTGSILTRLFRRTMLRNEYRVYSKLYGLRGVPRCYGLLQGRYLVLEYIDGVPVRDIGIADLDAFFEDFLDLIKELHRAGVAHGDLKKKDNLLIVDGRLPYVVDFGVAIVKKEGRAPLNRCLYNLARKFDFNAWIKLKYRYKVNDIAQHDRQYYNRTVIEKVARWIKRIYLIVKKKLVGQRKNARRH